MEDQLIKAELGLDNKKKEKKENVSYVRVRESKLAKINGKKICMWWCHITVNAKTMRDIIIPMSQGCRTKTIGT